MGTYLRELPVTVITCFGEDVTAMDIEPLDARIGRIKELMNSLPEAHLYLLREIMGLLHKVQLNQEANKMGADNLSRAFGPNLLWKPESQTDMVDLMSVQNNLLKTNMVIKFLLIDFEKTLMELC